MKHNPLPHRRALLAPALLALLFFATGCVRLGKADGWASPVADGDTVIAQTKNGVISALTISGDRRAPTAAIRWTYPAENDDIKLKAVYATPIIDGDTVYIASYSGIVVALDIATGRPVPAWGGPIDVDDHIVATPVLQRGTLYVATENGDLFTIDVTNGAQTPLFAVNDRVWGRPAIDGGRLYVAALDSQLRAIDRSSGQLQWQRDVGTVASDLLTDGDLLFVGSFSRELYAIDLTASGAERWVARGDAWFWARPLVAANTVYAGTVGGTVYAFDRDDGRQRWSFHHDDTEIRSAPVLIGGVLVVASRDGFLYGINPADGGALWVTELDGQRFLADPLVLESTVVYADKSGDLWQVTPANGEARLLFERG